MWFVKTNNALNDYWRSLGAQEKLPPTLGQRPHAAARLTEPVTQVSRAAMTEVLAAPYITAARSRGLSFPQTLVRHGLRNSMLPVMTLFSFWFAGLLGGSVVIEVIFNIPGMGRLLYSSVVNNDVPVIQGGMMWILTIAVVVTTLTDLLYGVLNPAIRVNHA